MSHYDYTRATHPSLRGAPFYALIMAAMLNADTTNAAKLRDAFPEVWAEVAARYWSPGGELPGDGTERTVIRELTEEEIADLANQHDPDNDTNDPGGTAP